MKKTIFYLFAVAVLLSGTVARADEWDEYGYICASLELISKKINIKFTTRKGQTELSSIDLNSASGDDSDKEFVKEINRLMDNDWQPLGGVAISIAGFCQAMVK